MIGDRCAYLGLDAIQIERLGRNVSLWISNFKTKSFCWKRLALFDVGTGPQQNLKKRQKIVSTLDVSYALRHLQASLHHLKRSLHVNQEMTFHFSMIDNQNTWMKHDVTFTCMRLLSNRFFRSNPVAADQHVDTAGGGQSSEIGSLPCTNLYTMIFETLRTCIHSTWKMGFMGCLLILCQFDCWYGLHATMRQAVMIWHSSKVIGSPVFWIMLWEDKHCNSQKFKSCPDCNISCYHLLHFHHADGIHFYATVSYYILAVQVQPKCSPSPLPIFKAGNEFGAD